MTLGNSPVDPTLVAYYKINKIWRRLNFQLATVTILGLEFIVQFHFFIGDTRG